LFTIKDLICIIIINRIIKENIYYNAFIVIGMEKKEEEEEDFLEK
jgi:hypothetical protein